MTSASITAAKPQPGRVRGRQRTPVRTRLVRVAGTAVVLVLFAFLVAPLVVIIPMSFSSASTLRFPPPGYSLQHYVELFKSSAWLDSLWMSLRVGVGASIIATLLATPAAFGMFRYSFSGKQVIRSLLILPLVTPYIVTGVAAYLFFAPLGLINSPWTLTAIHAAMAFPLTFLVVSASLNQFDMDLQRAALSLGATPWRAFRRVVLPLNLRGVVAGALFAFVLSFGESVVVIFIAGRGSQTLPKRVWDAVLLEVDPVIAVVSALMTAATLVALSVALVLQYAHGAGGDGAGRKAEKQVGLDTLFRPGERAVTQRQIGGRDRNRGDLEP